MDTFALALLLSLIAGLSTTFGCVISFIVKNPSPVFISIIMGFSAGVMILISFVELLQEGINSLGFLPGLLFFFLGMIIMLVIDVSISHQYEFEESLETLFKENGSHEYKPLSQEIGKGVTERGHRYGRRRRYRHNKAKNVLERTSIFVFLGVFIHNFPEGMATFIATIKGVELGLVLAFAIALHNIPEGIAVSVPIYISTGSRKRAFFWSFLSGISEFFGALLVGLILLPFINEAILAAMLAIVAGLMVYISLDELLPLAHSLGKEHHAILGIILGMFVIALSLFLLQ